MHNKKLKLVVSLLMCILGNFIVAFGVIAFLEPNGLITGGVSGISLALHYLTGWNTSIFSAIINVFFLILGLIFLGKRYTITAVLSSIVSPLWMALLEQFDYSYFLVEGDLLIPAISAAALIGVGIGIVIRSGSSTGGVDIPILILNKYFGFPIGLGLSLVDFIIIFAQFTTVGYKYIVYALLMIVVYTFIIDKMLLLGNHKMEIKIMTSHKEHIAQVILHGMDRGLTYVHCKTGYLREEKDCIVTVVDTRELAKFKNMIYTIDPEAFVVITGVQEVRGKGFSMPKLPDPNLVEAKEENE